MNENPIYRMVLSDFERFPSMWLSYVQRRSVPESPIHALARALDTRDLDAAKAAFATLPKEILQTPTGQIGRAMLDFALSDSLKRMDEHKIESDDDGRADRPQEKPQG